MNTTSNTTTECCQHAADEEGCRSHEKSTTTRTPTSPVRRTAALLSAIAFAAGAFVFAGGQAHAATPPIEITKVYFDSPGSDNRSNTSLNAEYVRLTNRRSYTLSLGSWSLRDPAGHVYRFPSTFSLRGGKSVIVHTGRGTNSSTHRYWGQGNYVWNNTGDTAYLRKSTFALVDKCRWGSSGSYTYC